MKMLSIALLLLAGYANALPDGAPTSICNSMLPSHPGVEGRQTTPSPYEITSIRTRQGYIVSIRSATELPFEGFMLQARLPSGEVAGTFQTIDNSVHTIDCQNPGDTVTHSSTASKAFVEVGWKPPQGYEGPIIFNSTIAQDYSTFWVGVTSPSQLVSNVGNFDEVSHFDNRPQITTPPHYIPEETPLTKKADSFYNSCGRTKVCFGTPNGCVNKKDCEVVTSVTAKNARYEFEIKTSRNVLWAAVGLSDDDKMGDDSVLECVKETSGVNPYLSWTDPRPKLDVNRIRNPQQGIELVNSSVVDGTLYCKILRDVKTTINGVEFDLENNKYHLLVAAGSNLKSAVKVGFHDMGFLASGEKRVLSDVSDLEGASTLFYRLHGAFMLAAWIGTASIGTFIARYYKKTWVGKTVCGKDVWFTWHRTFMVLTWSLTMVAFALIFVEIQAWSSENNPHAILGTVVTALCFMQPIGAFFRPHPGTPKRIYFNWLHWLGGILSHIVAIVTIFFAVKLHKAELPQWFDYILAAFVTFHVIMHLILSILSCVSDNSSNQRISAFPMKDLNMPGKMNAHMVNVDAPYSTARKLLLGLYILVVGILTAALIVTAVLTPK